MKNPAYQITEKEKAFALTHLANSRDLFIKTIENMNNLQWNMRPGPGQWSAAECADHLFQTELYFFMPTVQKMLSEPADPGKMSEAAGKDQASIDSMEKRDFKMVGQPWEEQSEFGMSPAELISGFKEKRNEFIEFLKNSDDELRVHYTFFPGIETIDAYQFILFISAHTNRHTGQIEDIKQLAFYPKGESIHS